MRLAVVLHSLTAGGAERVVSRLAEAWSAHGHEVHLLLLAGPEDRPYFQPAPAVRVHALGLLGRSRSLREAVGATLRRVRRLREAVDEVAPTAVLSFLVEDSVLAVLAALGRRVPVLVCEPNAPSDEPLPRRWLAARWAAYRMATVVVFQTERVRTLFPGRVGARGVVIPNPVPIPGARLADPSAKRVVAVGRLVPQKGFDLLLEAFALALAREPAAAAAGWTLTIWGEGPERPRLEAQAARLGLAGRAELPGVSAEPGSWMLAGGVFALSSRFEGMPNVLIEAMAAGFAVVAADCRFGPREIVTDGQDGLLVPAEDVPALAGALARLMVDGDARRRLGEAARSSVARYELGAVARSWEDLVATVAGGGRP